MSSFQNLKDAISRIRKISSDFAKWDTTSLPEGKLGNGMFDAEEGCVLLERFVDTVESALKDEQTCIENVSPREMDNVGGTLEGAAQTLQNHDAGFVDVLASLIEPVRPFAMLSMEDMDNKRYRKIRNLGATLTEIDEMKARILRNYRKMERAESKISNLDSTISANQKQSEECSNMHAQMSGLLTETQSMRDDATARKAEIDQFSSLIQNREKSIASQEAATEEYKNKLTEFSAATEAAEAARNEENKKKLAEFSANCEASMKTVEKLIDSAEKALRLKTAQALGAAFRAKEEKSGNLRVKFFWLGLGLSAAGAAIYLGWLISSTGGPLTDAGTLLGRSLVMLVAVGVAGFAGKQYAKNKAIEEDYAYKAAVVNSYPGFASELGDDETRKEYVSRLLTEILQDPQRVRKAEKKNPFSRKTESLED